MSADVRIPEKRRKGTSKGSSRGQKRAKGTEPKGSSKSARIAPTRLHATPRAALLAVVGRAKSLEPKRLGAEFLTFLGSVPFAPFAPKGRLHPDALMWPDAPEDLVVSIGARGNNTAFWESKRMLPSASAAPGAISKAATA